MDKKKCKVQYVQGAFHKASEKLMIYLPTYAGFVRYDIHHSVVPEINCDCWRIDNAYHCDDDLNEMKMLSEEGEWECAVALKNRPDFSGGIMHGDEVFSDIKFVIDGKNKCLTELFDVLEFENMRIIENSLLFDPKDNTTVIANHGKEYIFTKDGLDLKQALTWQVADELSSCFLAMFPISKRVTDHVYFDVDYTQSKIQNPPCYHVENCKRATLYSDEHNFYADFSVSEYPHGYEGGDVCRVIDNNGSMYNKTYFRICTAGKSVVGQTWKSVTHYRMSLA